MALIFNGSTNVISGVAVGGLPDGIVDADMLASSAVTSAKLASGVGGKILQVKTNTTRDSTGSLQCTPNQAYVDIPDQNVTITPSSASNKIIIMFHQIGETNYDTHHYVMAVKRAISGGATTIIEGAAAGNRTQMLTTLTRSDGTNNNTSIDAAHCSGYLDSPNTTSAITYTVVVQDAENSNYYYYNRTANDDDSQYRERGLSWITVMEVSA